MIDNNSKFIITTNEESAALLIKTGFKLMNQQGKQWIFMNDNKMLFNNFILSSTTKTFIYTSQQCH